jgi:hypothetical protein
LLDPRLERDPLLTLPPAYGIPCVCVLLMTHDLTTQLCLIYLVTGLIVLFVHRLTRHERKLTDLQRHLKEQIDTHAHYLNDHGYGLYLKIITFFASGIGFGLVILIWPLKVYQMLRDAFDKPEDDHE